MATQTHIDSNYSNHISGGKNQRKGLPFQIPFSPINVLKQGTFGMCVEHFFNVDFAESHHREYCASFIGETHNCWISVCLHHHQSIFVTFGLESVKYLKICCQELRLPRTVQPYLLNSLVVRNNFLPISRNGFLLYLGEIHENFYSISFSRNCLKLSFCNGIR